ncbi:MAG: hypothetical protein JWO37_1420 [Acidimicrobiales bacterium]|jgi:hypothetical protein|nr:hypothetical protein [Acidimicrobiales bacterium]
MRLLRTLPVATLATMVAVVAAGCSSKPHASSTTAPEDVRAPAADVAQGLRQIDSIATAAATAAAGDKARAKQLDGQIEPVWARVEGTVKANEPDTYLALEDAFALLKNATDAGDSAKATQAAADVSKAVTAYVGKYPG